jgi:capsular exopolysaccharide synthesis family protein
LPGDAAFFLNSPELGAIPSASLDRQNGAPKSKALRLADFGSSTTALVSTSQPGGRSLVAEAFRVILTSLLFIGKRRPTQVMVVTSPGVSEGKTTVLSNLAVAYAETGRSVLVIDGDMRRPRLHEIFGISNELGLAGLLAHTESLDARSIFTATQRFQTTGVSVLPSGKPEVATSNLLHSKRLPELIALAREQFDIVLIDTPPMLHIADSRVVGSLADGVILIIRSRQTSRDAAITARRQLAEDGVPVIGIVLNDWNPKVAGYYSTYDYAKYYEGRS